MKTPRKSRLARFWSLPLAFSTLFSAQTVFSHPIDDLLEDSTVKSEAVRHAANEQNQANAARRRVLASFLPTPEIQASYTRLNDPTTLSVDLGPIALPPVEVPIMGQIQLPDMELDLPPFMLSDEDIFRAALRLTLPIIAGGRRLALLDATDKGIEARDLAREAAERGTRLKVVLAYLKALEAKELAQIWQTRTEFDQKLLALQEERASTGAGVALDRDRAKVQLSDSQRRKSEAESKLHRRVEELNHLARRDLKGEITLEELPEDWFQLPAERSTRPDIEAQRKGASALQYQATAESRKLYPTLALQGEVGYKKGDPGFIDGDTYWQATVVLQWNLMADWNVRMAAEEAEIKGESARIDAELAQERAELEITQAQGQLEDVERALKVAEEGVEAATSGETNAQRAYDLGGISLDLLLSTKTRKAEMEEHALEARYGRKQAIVYLRYLSGLEPLSR